MSRFLKKYWHLIVLALIILLGGFLRFYRISEISNFSYDQARDAEVMRKIVQDHKFTLLGPPTSVSSDNVGYGTTYFGPIFYYILAPGLLLGHMDPIGPMILIALVNTISIFLVYFIIRKLTDSHFTSLLGACFYSVSPACVAHSRFIWNPNLITFFVSLFLISMILFLEKQQLFFLFLAGLFSGILTQLHFYNYFFVIFSIVFLYFQSRSKQRITLLFLKKFFFYILGLVIALFPMIIFEIRHNFLNTRSIIYNLFHPHNSEVTFGLNFYHINLFVKSLIEKCLGLNINITYLASSFLIAFLIFFLLDKKNRRENFFLFYVLLFFIGFLGSSIFDYRGILGTRYLLPFSVIFFIFLAICLGNLVKSQSVFIYSLAILLIAFLILNSLTVSWRQVSVLHPFSLGFCRDVSKIIIQDIKENSEREINIANLYNTQRRAISFRYFLKAQKIPILGVEQYPQADILYVIDKDYGWDGIVNNTDTWEVYSFQPKVLLKVLNGPGGVKIYKIGKKKNG